MKFNPLNTLTGRMVLVTIVAVLLSYGIAFAIYANERGAALRRAAETGVIERVVFTAERLREIPATERGALIEAVRDYSIRYSVSDAPNVSAGLGGGAGARIARGIAERLPNMQVHAATRFVDAPSRRFRGRDGRDRDRDAPLPDDLLRAAPGLDEGRVFVQRIEPPPGDEPRIQATEVTLSIELSQGSWLNARARLPGPRPAPLSVLAAAIVSVIVVGIGAALVSRQIGRPLADLAAAARALGSGQTNVAAPVSGPDDVRRASTAFNAMAERLGHQLSRQRQMLWALSHDLRTPITAIRLRAELIEDESERQRLLASVAEMEQLTEQALSLARAGASEEERVSVDLAEIARTLCGELQDMGVNIVAEADTPVFAECRPSEIARAARNLAENAAKYGGGGIMRVYRDDAHALIEVRDQGMGVPEEQIAALSAPFFRADSARSAANGAGLGLAIAQAIAEAHGGKLALANLAPHGFSAKLILPL
ncbi:MAG: HAMP domain-containing histidine kinase [Caulobacterales bacterium]|nr:HAMP domain-containing histidine kinase [Caulobacterales bacterium]